MRAKFPNVDSFTNTNLAYRELEDLRDLIASVEDNGEIKPGELAELRARLIRLDAAARTRRP